MKFKYIMYNDHYGTGIIAEAIKDPKHILWSAIPENDSYKMFRDVWGYVEKDEEINEYEMDSEIVKRIFNDNYVRMGKPNSMSLAFYNIDNGTIANISNVGKLEKAELLYADGYDVLDPNKIELTIHTTFE